MPVAEFISYNKKRRNFKYIVIKKSIKEDGLCSIQTLPIYQARIKISKYKFLIVLKNYKILDLKIKILKRLDFYRPIKIVVHLSILKPMMLM